MARYTGAVCRLCRREGTKLFLKGTKCLSDRCPHREAQLSPRPARQRPQGQDRGLWPATARKAEGQAHVLHARRPVPRVLREGQPRPGVTGELLIQQLERRLDNVAFRLGFAISRRQARQVVRHGHVTVNGRKVNIPSYQVNVGDEIAIRESAKKLLIVEQGAQYAAQNPVPAWLEANFENLSGRVLCTCPSVPTSTCPSTSS